MSIHCIEARQCTSCKHVQFCNLLVCAAHVDKIMLTRQLSDQVLHLESQLFLANAQLTVAKLEKSSYQSAFEEAARQLSFHEAEASHMQKQLAAKQSEVEVSQMATASG